MKRKLELLLPVNYEETLEERKTSLEKLIKYKQSKLNEKNNLKNAGKIRIVRHKNALQFYLISKKNDTTGKYLSREQDDFAKSLIQFDYDEKIIKSAQRELAAIKKLLSQNKTNGIQKIFQRYSKNRKPLITPVTLTDEEYEKQWLSQKHIGNNYYEDGEYFTTKGEKVRSKSEVIIADTLARLKIPYKYEVPIELKNGKTIYPDFCCLNLRTRQEIYWEHFGLMDDPEYITKTIIKIQNMQESGFLLGKHFIFSMEKPECPLNPKFVEKMAEQYFS